MMSLGGYSVSVRSLGAGAWCVDIAEVVLIDFYTKAGTTEVVKSTAGWFCAKLLEWNVVKVVRMFDTG